MAFPVGSSSKKFTIDNTKVSGTSDLSNFPVLIKDANITSAVYTAMEGDGDDIRFTSDSAGTTELAFEIVSLNAGAETCEIWVKIPTVSYNSNTVFYIWYGDASLSAYAVTDPYGRNAVWADYDVVYHMQDVSSPVDATGNGQTLTNSGATNTTGEIGGGTSFVAASSQKMSKSSPSGLPSGNSNLTVQAWLAPDGAPVGTDGIVAWGTEANYQMAGIYLSSSLLYWVGFSNDSSTAYTCPTDGTFFMCHATCDTSKKLNWYVNGSQQGSEATLTNTPNIGTTFLYIGDQRPGSHDYYNGVLDEIRIRSSVLTSDWIDTEHESQSSPTTFITMSDIGSTGNFLLMF